LRLRCWRGGFHPLAHSFKIGHRKVTGIPVTTFDTKLLRAGSSFPPLSPTGLNKGQILLYINMGHGAWRMGHGAWGMGHGAWGMGHGAWGRGHNNQSPIQNPKSLHPKSLHPQCPMPNAQCPMPNALQACLTATIMSCPLKNCSRFGHQP
jgi:hypothetical protein